jgi:MoaA/NifB/PqqE/SkfB family radical SAM enzyme
MNLKQLVKTTWRRRSWLFGQVRPGQLLNLAKASRDFALKRETTTALPAVVKIDITPNCNLSCTMCVHADPNGSERIDDQVFKGSHRMSVDRYRGIIDRIAGKTLAVTLYTWGDPLTHSDLDEMCRIAEDANLESHISTNFSFKLSDERIRSLVESGLTHLTVCVDGLTQENYSKTRVGGRIDWVLSNLRRVLAVRDELGQKFPVVEVQYIKYQHNVHEVEEARELVEGWGADEFSTFWGALHNLADIMPDKYQVHGPKKNGKLPRCYWPHFSTVIKYNGDVIPCCEHRQAAQHVGPDSRGDDEARTLGNVFEKGLEEIWNSHEYQEVRRLVSNPERSNREVGLKKNFCDGCFVCFDTSIGETSRRWGSELEFEDIFDLDQRGRPVRKLPIFTGLPE